MKSILFLTLLALVNSLPVKGPEVSKRAEDAIAKENMKRDPKEMYIIAEYSTVEDKNKRETLYYPNKPEYIRAENDIEKRNEIYAPGFSVGGGDVEKRNEIYAPGFSVGGGDNKKREADQIYPSRLNGIDESDLEKRTEIYSAGYGEGGGDNKKRDANQQLYPSRINVTDD